MLQAFVLFLFSLSLLISKSLLSNFWRLVIVNCMWLTVCISVSSLSISFVGGSLVFDQWKSWGTSKVCDWGLVKSFRDFQPCPGHTERKREWKIESSESFSVLLLWLLKSKTKHLIFEHSLRKHTHTHASTPHSLSLTRSSQRACAAKWPVGQKV